MTKRFVKAHIAIVTGAPLCRNPRVVKEAQTLGDAGYRVTVLRPVFSQAFVELDDALASDAPWTVQTTVDLTSGRVAPAWWRLVRRLGSEATQRGAQRPESLGYGIRRTLSLARAVDADLTIGHQEVGLWVANRLAEEGRHVGVDLEDWYSEDLSAEARRSRPLRLLRREEAVAVRRGSHVTTTSNALADALVKSYGGPKPTVVYNAFPWAERANADGLIVDRSRGHRDRLSLHWVSQTIGVGRGLESVLDALTMVDVPVEVHLRGTCSPEVEAMLRRRLPSGRGHSLLIHDLVPPDELLSRIAEHDVGLALEAHEPKSRDLTVTNKILHYLLAGLPVLATDTSGQQEIAQKVSKAVCTFRVGDTAELARQIEHLASDQEARSAAARAAVDAARREFSWEVQQEVLLQSVRNALAERGISEGS